MKILLYKSSWEAGAWSFSKFLDTVKEEAYDGVEVYIASRLEDRPEEIREGCAIRNLGLIAQVITEGRHPTEHIESFAAQIDPAVAAGAWAVNSHIGSDFFTFEDNVRIFRECARHAAGAGLPLWHETHRGRALFNLPGTLRYLEALPDLELVADISHFMTVHESNLRDRADLLAALVPRIRHLHVRIGFEEGPQVSHPLAPEWAPMLDFYLDFWVQVANARREAGAEALTLTPEAGPPPYMPTLPFSNAPVADAWRVNLDLAQWLRGVDRLTSPDS